MASSYTSNSNGSVWTFQLRQGVTFSDGTPFNATAVKDSIDWEIIAHNGGGASSLAAVIPGANAFLKSNQTQQDVTTFEQNDGITIQSPYSIQFRLAVPFVSFLAYMGDVYYTYMVSPTAILAHGGVTPGVGSSWLVSHSAGTGPYVVGSYNAETGTVVFDKNPSYWAVAQLGLKQPFNQVTVNVVPNILTEELNVRTGASNMMLLPASNFYDFANKTAWTTQNRLVSAVPGTSIWGPYPTANFYVYMLNTEMTLPNGTLAKVQPFLNQDMVKAFNYAWNESYYVQNSLNGLGTVTPGILLQGEIGYTSFPSPYPFNLTLAQHYIESACASLGCSKSNPITIPLYIVNDPAAESAAAILASNINSLQAGVSVNVIPGVYDSFLSAFLGKQEGILLGEFNNFLQDPLVAPLQFLGDNQNGFGAIFTGYNDTTTLTLLNQAGAASDITTRSGLYSQIAQQIASTGHYIPIAQFDAVVVTSSSIHVVSYNEWLGSYLPTIMELG